MAAKKAKLSAGRRTLNRRAAGRLKHFGADLKVCAEMDLENLAKTARLVLVDVGLHQAGSIGWDYKGQTPAEAQTQMELVLKLVAAEERRRAGLLNHPVVASSASTEEDEDIGRGSR